MPGKRPICGDRFVKDRHVAGRMPLTRATDNTNAEPDTRAIWIDLANKHKLPIRCVWFKTPLTICEHNDAVRSLNATVWYSVPRRRILF